MIDVIKVIECSYFEGIDPLTPGVRKKITHISTNLPLSAAGLLKYALPFFKRVLKS